MTDVGGTEIDINVKDITTAPPLDSVDSDTFKETHPEIPPAMRGSFLYSERSPNKNVADYLVEPLNPRQDTSNHLNVQINVLEMNPNNEPRLVTVLPNLLIKLKGIYHLIKDNPEIASRNAGAIRNHEMAHRTFRIRFIDPYSQYDIKDGEVSVAIPIEKNQYREVKQIRERVRALDELESDCALFEGCYTDPEVTETHLISRAAELATVIGNQYAFTSWRGPKLSEYLKSDTDSFMDCHYLADLILFSNRIDFVDQVRSGAITYDQAIGELITGIQLALDDPSGFIERVPNLHRIADKKMLTLAPELAKESEAFYLKYKHPEPKPTAPVENTPPTRTNLLEKIAQLLKRR